MRRACCAKAGARQPRRKSEFTSRLGKPKPIIADELERIRAHGWADAFEEREPGLNAIAAPVWSAQAALAGIVALQGPIPRFGRAAARKALPLLLERTQAISRELGCSPPRAPNRDS